MIGLAFAEIVAEQALHLQHHYGVNLGIAIIPISLIIFIAAVHFLLKNGKTAKNEKFVLSEKKIAELKKLMERDFWNNN